MNILKRYIIVRKILTQVKPFTSNDINKNDYIVPTSIKELKAFRDDMIANKFEIQTLNNGAKLFHFKNGEKYIYKDDLIINFVRLFTDEQLKEAKSFLKSLELDYKGVIYESTLNSERQYYSVSVSGTYKNLQKIYNKFNIIESVWL